MPPSPILLDRIREERYVFDLNVFTVNFFMPSFNGLIMVVLIVG